MFGTTADCNDILKLQINSSWFALDLFFCTGEKLRRCTEPERERMSGIVMELNDMEQNYIDFGKETDSDNAINDSDEAFAL